MLQRFGHHVKPHITLVEANSLVFVLTVFKSTVDPENKVLSHCFIATHFGWDSNVTHLHKHTMLPRLFSSRLQMLLQRLLLRGDALQLHRVVRHEFVARLSQLTLLTVQRLKYGGE